MKKIILLTALLISAAAGQAQNSNAAVSYVYSPDFNQIRANVSFPIDIFAHIGAEGRYVKDKISPEKGGYKDPIFSVYLPMQLDWEFINLTLAPFYYFKTKGTEAMNKDPYAYGATALLQVNLQENEVEELYTQAYLQAGFSRQRGLLQKNDTQNDANYSQLAYTLGIRQNFFSAFMFHFSGTAYHYPQGIKGVQYFKGIFDQNDLAFTQSYDISRQLGKYVLSTRMTRIWPQEHSSLYLGYHYAEFYTADPQHSFLAGNSFYVSEDTFINAAYNHLQTVHNKNKRDIFYISINSYF